MKYSGKGHKDKNRDNRIKKSRQAWLVYIKDINRNIPTTWRWNCGDSNFSSQSTFSADCLTVSTHPCAIACINICAHVKDPVVCVRVWWIKETLKHPACTMDWVVRLLQLAFPGESNPNLPWKKSQWDNTVVKKKKKNPPSSVLASLMATCSLFDPVLWVTWACASGAKLWGGCLIELMSHELWGWLMYSVSNSANYHLCNSLWKINIRSMGHIEFKAESFILRFYFAFFRLVDKHILRRLAPHNNLSIQPFFKQANGGFRFPLHVM